MTVAVADADAVGRGTFLVLEGPEGAGKTTQATILAARLRAAGHRVDSTREPGGTPAAQRIRELVLDDPTLRIDALPEFLLYAAARAQHVVERIAPKLDAGWVVLCDRFTASSLAYQGHGRGLPLSFVRELNERATAGVSPDATVLLDLAVASGRDRIAARGATDRLEGADSAFHERVRNGFLDEAAGNGSWLVLDALQDEETLASAIWKHVETILPPPPADASAPLG